MRDRVTVVKLLYPVSIFLYTVGLTQLSREKFLNAMLLVRVICLGVNQSICSHCKCRSASLALLFIFICELTSL